MHVTPFHRPTCSVVR